MAAMTPLLVLALFCSAWCAAVVVTEGKCNMRLHNDGTEIGVVTIKQEIGSKRSEISISLKSDKLKDGKHGFHVHQYGVLKGEDCVSTGGHYNPKGHDHAAPEKKKRHIGDLGNVEAANGAVEATLTDKLVRLRSANNVLGRAIVIHDGEDDLGLGGDEGSLKTGNAGSRVACCTIAVSKDESTDNYQISNNSY